MFAFEEYNGFYIPKTRSAVMMNFIPPSPGVPNMTIISVDGKVRITIPVTPEDLMNSEFPFGKVVEECKRAVDVYQASH